jgi:hypothetical protein
MPTPRVLYGHLVEIVRCGALCNAIGAIHTLLKNGSPDEEIHRELAALAPLPLDAPSLHHDVLKMFECMRKSMIETDQALFGSLSPVTPAHDTP